MSSQCLRFATGGLRHIYESDRSSSSSTCSHQRGARNGSADAMRADILVAPAAANRSAVYRECNLAQLPGPISPF